MRSKVIRGAGVTWPGVPVHDYKDRAELYRDVVRRTLLGGGTGEEPLAFELRYFEIAPGGFTTLEHHLHPHGVVVLSGRGTVRLGQERFEIAPFDTVYVAPDEPHQFRADRGAPLGFLCVVDRERDRPVPVGGDPDGAPIG